MNEQHTEIFKSFVENQLNKPQRDAVIVSKGALLVVAGAGSGKTRVITARIAQLMLHDRVYPSSIVALTFTNKAAGEMRERLEKFLGPNKQLPFVGTFHSYCLQLLRSNAALLPFPQFTIIDGEDQTSLLKKIIKHNALEKFATPSQLVFQISTIKNKLFMGDEDAFGTPMIKEIYYAYETEKTAARAYDFDDLIINVLNLFQKNEQFRKRFQERVKHLLVDEYQDTSHTQHALLKAIALNDDKEFCLDSVCAVGDEDQSIYSWRGATVTNMLKFQKDFEPVTRIKIEQNYRSVQPILHAANSLIRHNRLRNPKELWSEKKADNRILLLSSRSGEQEAEAIARMLKTLTPERKLSDVAILYRTHFQSRALEEALLYHGIPYRIVGGIRFYERKEIKDVLAYLKLIINPFDKISFLRVINYPTRGLGDRFEEQVLQAWDMNPFLDFKQLLTQICDGNHFALPPAKKVSVKSFLALYDGLEKDQSITKVVDTILAKTDYLNNLRVTLDAREADTKIENVRELLQSMMTFERSAKGTSQDDVNEADDYSYGDPFAEDIKPMARTASLESFLHEVALMQEKIEDDKRTDQVQMMTLHAAKGLEFETVIISGLEEGLLPSARSLTTNESLEEERRLFYVGVTRACEYLVLSHASSRNTYGSVTDQVPSRFIDEVDSKFLQVFEVDKVPTSMITARLREFLGLKAQSSGMLTFFKDAASTIVANQEAQTKVSAMVRDGASTSSPRAASGSFSPFPQKDLRNSYATARGEEPARASRTMATATVTKPKPEVIEKQAAWYKNQSVNHKKFGRGIVLDVEPASDGNFNVTAIFKDGKKKILSTFLESL